MSTIAHHHWADDVIVADRVRSELGPLLKSLDHPHVHVGVVDGVVTLHGDAADLGAGAAIEAQALATAGVHGLDSHLHIGLLPSDTRPSAGRRAERGHRSHHHPRGLTARDVMTSAFVSIGPDETLFAAFDTITRSKIHHLPVVRPDGRCVAVLDAMTTAARLPEAWIHGHTSLVQQAGKVGPLSVLAATPLARVAEEMTIADVDVCCVVDEHGRMMGLITARDIVAAVAGIRPREAIASTT